MSTRRTAIAIAFTLLIPIALPLIPTAAALAPGATFGSGIPTFINYAAPAGGDATSVSEPSIGVNWDSGAVMFPGDTYSDVQFEMRVDFNDNANPPTATWTDVTPPFLIGNVDPILFTYSPVGRTWAGGLQGTCSVLAITDDDGENWIPGGNSCVGTLDHETLAAGPFHDPLPTEGVIVDYAVYYCAQASFVTCAYSYDGGLTYGPSLPVPCEYSDPAGHGSLSVAADGTVYLPFLKGVDHLCVAKSIDNGRSWTDFVFTNTTPPEAFDADMATTPSSYVWIAYPEADGSTHAALSKDGGATWTFSRDLGQEFGLTVGTFHEVIAGDDDRAAVAFLGTTGTGGVTSALRSTAFNGDWHLYISYTYDGGKTWSTVRATTDPVQRGMICSGGFSPGCPTVGAGVGRNLLDFMDATVDADGRVLVGYADGCVAACALSTGTKSQSTAAWGTISRQTTGRGLFAAKDGISVDIVAPLTGTVGSALTLSANVNAEAPYTATVNWGDASPVEVFSGQTASLFTANHAYASTGEHDITLTIVDNGGGSASDTTTASISGGSSSGSIRIDAPIEGDPVGDLVTVSGIAELGSNLAPTAAFSFVVTGNSVAFDASASTDPESAPLAFVWAFGDSTSGGGETVSHTYASPGTYEVCLTVSDGSLSDELCQNVTIGSTSTRTLIATDPAGDAKNPTLVAIGQGTNVPTLDILKLEAEMNANGEPVFHLQIANVGTPTAPTSEAADGATWRVEWTHNGKVDFVQVAVSALGTVSAGYGDTDTQGIYSQRGTAPFTVTQGTPGTFTMTYPAAALATRGYTPTTTLSSVEGTTLVYRGTPQDVSVSAGGTTGYDATAPEDFVLSAMDPQIALIGAVNAQAAKPAPSSPPANPHITDTVADPIGDNVPTLDIEAGWFDSDATNLYVGAKIADIPADTNSTAFLYYSINFKPEYIYADAKWNGAVGASNTFTGLRVTALYSPVAGDGIPSVPHTEDATKFELQALSVAGAQNNFGTVAEITGSISPTTDIIWWVVPRAVLQNPGEDAFLSTTSGASAPAVGGTVTFGGILGDSTGTGLDYTFPQEDIVAPTATLTATPASGVAPLTVAFGASVTGTIASWTLTYGDGDEATGTGAVPAALGTHVYDSVGTYTATLSVLATNGQSGTGQATIVVSSTPPAGVEVVVSVAGIPPVSADCTTDCATWDAQLDLSSLAEGEHTITATLKSNGNVLATDTVGVSIARTPQLVITAPIDGSDVASGEITVTGKITGAASNAPPMAIMGADRSSGLAPLSVTFTLDGTDDRGIASWRFESGDGNVVDGTDLPATHVETYETAGTYHARLTVTDTNGATHSVTGVITAQAENQPPGVPTLISPALGATGLPLTVLLSYGATDPDGNALTYDVYLDTTGATTLVGNDQTASYLAGGLVSNTQYFWRVVASDGTASTSGPVWTFTTGTGPLTEADKAHVVIGITDSGINPYSTQFRRSWLTENPASYISGMPANVKQINLCFFDNLTKTVDQSRCPASPTAAPDADAAEWAKVKLTPTSQQGAGSGNLYWFAGTNVFTISYSHSGDANFIGLDGVKGGGDSHGTGTASDAVGATTGTCPECFVVMLEAQFNTDLGPAYTWLSNQPYIDVITSSVGCGPLGHNPGGVVTPVCGAPTSVAVKNAVTKGKLVFQASGNGIGNAGAAPTTTAWYESFNPWTINVGCVMPTNGQECPYSDSPNEISASGAFRYVASVNSYTGTATTAGTSFASPSAAGVAARTIYALRTMYGDTTEGATATGEKSIVRTGSATLPTGGPLANGALTRLELEEVLFKTARRDILPKVPQISFPAEGVNTPLSFIKEGYGEVYRGNWGVNHSSAVATWSSSGDALSVILGSKAMPNRWLEETWWETVVQPVQTSIYGAEVPDSDTDAFPTNSAFDPTGLDGYTGMRTLDALQGMSATVPVGTVPTPSLNRLYFHHNVLPGGTTYEKYLNNVENPAQGNAACVALNPDANCPDWTGIGATGVAPAGNQAVYTVAYPNLGAPLLLDTSKDVVIHVSASGFAQPPTPLALRATITSAGALVGTGVSGLPAVSPPFDGVYEIRFKPTASVLTDLVEVTIAWDGPAYSFHVNSQGASWIDLPIAATLPPVDYEPVVYYLDNFAAFNTNGGTIALTRDATKLAGDPDRNGYWTFPQPTGLVMNLQAEDALATTETLLAGSGTAQVFLCTNQVDAGAASYTAKLTLSVDGAPIGGGSITKELIGSNSGRATPVSIPISLSPHLLTQGVPLTGAFTLSGPGGVFAENQGVCGGGATHPWKITLGLAELDTTPTATIDELAGTLSGTQTISGTANFPAVPMVGETTWFARDMDTWDTMVDTITLDTIGPGTSSPGPFLEPGPTPMQLTMTSVRDARADAPVISTSGLGTAAFWVSAVPASTDVTVDVTVLLRNGASDRLVGSGSLTKHMVPPLGTVAPIWDQEFVVGFTPLVSDPQPGEKLVMIVKLSNLPGGAHNGLITCLCGGPDMPVYVSLPTDVSTVASSPVVDLTLGEIAEVVPVVDGEWTIDVDTRSIENGDYTVTAIPRATYGGTARTGEPATADVSVLNTAVNTPPTAELAVSPLSGPAPLLVSATLGGSDTQTADSALAWSMDWGDGSPAESGTGVPAARTHTYAVGNYLATLTVTDAGGMIDTATLSVSAFTPPPVERVLVILDGGAPVEATDVTGDGSFRDWSATFSIPNAGVHTLTARHMSDDTVLRETTIGFNTVGNVLDLFVSSPSDGTVVGRGAQISGGTTYNGVVEAVEASIDDFATTVAATTSDGFVTWSVDVDALGLPDDASTLIAIRASSVDGQEFTSVTLYRNAAPNPAIEIVTPLPVLTGETVQFQAGGTLAEGGAPIVSWAWAFGDGATSTDANPSTSYEDDGVYDVTLTVTDADGGVGTASAQVLILNRLPTVSLSTSPQDPTTADTVTLTATGSDVDGTVESYETTAYGGPTRESGVLATGGSALSLQFPDDGNFLLVARAVDDDGGAAETETLLTVHNLRPIAALTATPALVGEGGDVTLDASASSDPDGSIVEYRFDPGDESGIVSFPTSSVVHTYGNPGVYAATVTVVDDDGSEITSAPVTIQVNSRPVLDNVGNKVVAEGGTLTFTLVATDAESDEITYTMSPTPDGASLDPSTGVFTWTPTFDQEGSYPVTFTASDGLSEASRNSIISVGNVPLPPTLDPIGAKNGIENSMVFFTVTASDPDSPYTLSATGLPSGAVFDANTGMFGWTPTFTQAGAYLVTFSVTDGSFTFSEDVQITIANLDRAPVLAPFTGGSVLQLSTITVPLSAADADGDTITFSVEGPEGMVVQDLGNGNARLVWTPVVGQLGPYTATVFATSGELAASATGTFTALFKTDVALAQLSPSTQKASPGQTISLSTLVRNTGPQTDTFAVTVVNGAGWVTSPAPAPVTLEQGATAYVNVTVVTDGAKPISWTSVKVVSVNAPSVTKTTQYRIDIPVVVKIELDNVTIEGEKVTDKPSGRVILTHLDGTAAADALVTATQTPDDLGLGIAPVLRSTRSGASDSDGVFAFDFTQQPGGATPGVHQLVIVAKKAGGYESVIVTSYTIVAS